MYLKIRKFVYDTIENEDHKSGLSYLINTFLIILIIANVAAFVAESEPSIKNQFATFFINFENFSVAIFSIEYLLRVWCIPEKEGGTLRQALIARINWVKSPMALIDLLAILPTLLQRYFAIDLRILRLLRLLRILKLSRYSSALRMLLNVLARESKSLGAMLLILIVLILMAASGIYLVESKVQPEHFGSVPRATWWAVVTLTTVGYGDVTPITPLGKLFGACITILGIGIAALPAGILAGGFAEELSGKKQENELFFRELLENHTGSFQTKELEKLRKKAGVSREVAIRTYKEMKDNQPNHYDNSSNICDKCGKHLNK